MSARREDILNTFWDDEAVDELSNSAVLLYVWSWTNQKCGMSGVYRCKRRALCEGRLTPKQLEKALEELQAANLLYRIDGWLWVVGRVKNLSGINPNMARAIVKDIDNLPDYHEFRAAFVAKYSGYSKLETAFTKAKPPMVPLAEHGLVKPFPKPLDNPSATDSGGDGGRDGGSSEASQASSPPHTFHRSNVVATTRGQGS